MAINRKPLKSNNDINGKHKFGNFKLLKKKVMGKKRERGEREREKGGENLLDSWRGKGKKRERGEGKGKRGDRQRMERETTEREKRKKRKERERKDKREREKERKREKRKRKKKTYKPLNPSIHDQQL